MFHLIPFAVGVVAGAVVLQLIRTDKTKQGLEKAQGKLRGATVSSLEAIEGASARARARLAEKQEVAPEEAAAGEEAVGTTRAASEPMGSGESKKEDRLP